MEDLNKCFQGQVHHALPAQQRGFCLLSMLLYKHYML